MYCASRYHPDKCRCSDAPSFQCTVSITDGSAKFFAYDNTIRFAIEFTDILSIEPSDYPTVGRAFNITNNCPYSRTQYAANVRTDNCADYSSDKLTKFKPDGSTKCAANSYAFEPANSSTEFVAYISTQYITHRKSIGTAYNSSKYLTDSTSNRSSFVGAISSAN